MLNGISSKMHIIRVTWTPAPTQTETVFVPDFSYLRVSCIRICPERETLARARRI